MSQAVLKIVEFDRRIISLRQSILHPNGPESRVIYSTDKNERAIHVICQNPDSDEVLACGSLLPEDDDGVLSADKNRIRGMAVNLSAQGQGLGKMILLKMLDMSLQRNIKYTWCNARLAVLPFYQKRGFEIKGSEFDVPGSGPHYKMIRKI